MPEPQSSEMILKAYIFSCKSQAYLWCELFSVFSQAIIKIRGYFLLSFLFLIWSPNILDWMDRQMGRHALRAHWKSYMLHGKATHFDSN